MNKLITTANIIILCTLGSSSILANACTTTSGISITSSETNCYLWSSGDVSISNGVSVTSTSSIFATTGAVGTLTNNGDIIGTNTSGGGEPVRINNNVTSLVNSGLIQNQTSAFTVFVYNGTLSTLENSGQITHIGNYPTEAAVGVAYGNGVIQNLNNLATGLITTINHPALVAAYGGRIDNILNAGTLSVTSNSGSVGNWWGHGDDGSVIFNDAHITSITNTGNIYTDVPNAFGIYNNVAEVGFDTDNGQIDILNNLQGHGNIHGALTYTGNLPTHYNIIINSTSQYGQLSITNATGNMAFNIYGNTGTTLISGVNASVVTNYRYLNVLQGFSSLTGITGTTGTYSGYSYSLVAGSSTGYWDLLISGGLSGPSATDTQSSLHSLASKLRSGFSGQAIATNFANMNTYDCNLFDSRGLCISVGGQQTYVDNPSSNLTSTVVVAGYKVSPTLRIGGFLNQNLNNHTSANVDISNANPLMGLFAVWNQNEDHLGYQVKVANAYQDKDVRTIRDVVGTSEAGRGSTELNTQSYVGELSYAFMANEDKTMVRPYAAVRYTRIKQDGYTETGVSTPLTYAALSDRSTAALVGVKLNHKLAEKVNLTGSLGIEQDLHHHVDNLTATGVSGLTSENFNNNIKRTRPVASIGAYFTPAKNQRIAADLYYQQLPFQSTGSTTAYVNYMIGF